MKNYLRPASFTVLAQIVATERIRSLVPFLTVIAPEKPDLGQRLVDLDTTCVESLLARLEAGEDLTKADFEKPLEVLGIVVNLHSMLKRVRKDARRLVAELEDDKQTKAQLLIEMSPFGHLLGPALGRDPESPEDRFDADLEKAMEELLATRASLCDCPSCTSTLIPFATRRMEEELQARVKAGDEITEQDITEFFAKEFPMLDGMFQVRQHGPGQFSILGGLSDPDIPEDFAELFRSFGR